MNDKTTFTMRIDSKTKEEVSAIFKEFGLNMTTATLLFYKQVIKEQNIPFTIGKNKFTKELKKTIDDARRGIDVSEPCSFDEFKKIVECMK